MRLNSGTSAALKICYLILILGNADGIRLATRIEDSPNEENMNTIAKADAFMITPKVLGNEHEVSKNQPDDRCIDGFDFGQLYSETPDKKDESEILGDEEDYIFVGPQVEYVPLEGPPEW